MHICVSELRQHWFRQYLVAYLPPSYYLKQCWVIVNWTLINKHQWNCYRNTKLFIHKNASENIICKMAAILSKGRWVNANKQHHMALCPSSPSEHRFYILNWGTVPLNNPFQTFKFLTKNYSKNTTIYFQFQSHKGIYIQHIFLNDTFQVLSSSLYRVWKCIFHSNETYLNGLLSFFSNENFCPYGDTLLECLQIGIIFEQTEPNCTCVFIVMSSVWCFPDIKIAHFIGNDKSKHKTTVVLVCRKHHTQFVWSWPFISRIVLRKRKLTHCGLVMPYGNRDLGQHWLR